MRTGLALVMLIGLAACDDAQTRAVSPPAVQLTEEALGHFCQMNLMDHEGPKAQVHLEGFPMPIWFSQVRDGIAFLKSEERIAPVVAFYVNDMGAAASWATPGASNWVAGAVSFFVVGSDAIGGMGAPEIVPFGDATSAGAFAREKGGTVMTLSEIPAEIVLSPVETRLPGGGSAS